MYDTLIKANELLLHVEDKNWLIFDCRFDLSDVDKGQKSYAVSHLPGAIYAHLDDHLSSPITPDSGRHPMPDTKKLIQWLATCGLTEQTQVVVYDDSFAAMSSRLWWLLKCLGHEAVAILDGGWQAWVNQSLVVDSKLPELHASNFTADLNEHCVVTTRDVLNNINTDDFQLVDVRTNERFIGKLEPIDPVAGHIPGAMNMPLIDNLDENGFFKTAAQLKAMYSALCESRSAENQVYMCGSGVTACHSIFALSLAGCGFAKVYAGSWSEWIRDPGRPAAIGQE
ncbi:MAG: sulfurtransferase [Gammaproteobacteria bacterium]|nr:sulfurtransferase [Gammaproteobacteria bacterium]